MASRPYRTCSKCSARNKPEWEFCARCGESLEGAPATEGAAAPAAAAPPLRAVHPPTPGWSWTGAMMLIVGVAVAWWTWRVGPETPPGPALFTAPSLPPAAPPVARAVQATALDAGREHLAQGDVTAALPKLREAVAAAPESALAWLALAKALWVADDRAEAVAAFANAARFGPAEATAYRLEYARALEADGQAEPARTEYERVLAVQADHPGALQGLGRLLTQAGRASDALPMLRRAASASPDDVRTATALGVAYERTGDQAAALGQYRSVVDRFPDAAYPRVLLSEALDRQGQRDEALRVVREALGRNPREPLLQRGLGVMLDKRGDSAGALAAYREYLRLRPDAPDASAVAARAATLERGRPRPDTSSAG